jgi:hypothetical protein
MVNYVEVSVPETVNVYVPLAMADVVVSASVTEAGETPSRVVWEGKLQIELMGTPLQLRFTS